MALALRDGLLAEMASRVMRCPLWNHRTHRPHRRPTLSVCVFGVVCGSSLGLSRRVPRVFLELDELAAHLALEALAELEEVVAERLLHVDGALHQGAGDDDVGAGLD